MWRRTAATHAHALALPLLGAWRVLSVCIARLTLINETIKVDGRHRTEGQLHGVVSGCRFLYGNRRPGQDSNARPNSLAPHTTSASGGSAPAAVAWSDPAPVAAATCTRRVRQRLWLLLPANDARITMEAQHLLTCWNDAILPAAAWSDPAPVAATACTRRVRQRLAQY